jgi:cold shock CspA family protein
MSSVPTPTPENVVVENQTTEWTWDGDEERVYRGRVKWFQPRKGFGFVTLQTGTTGADGTPVTTDIFVYHKGIKVQVEQYRFLMEGEYIQFNLAKSDNPSQVCQAVNVRGVDGGMLMCETQNERNRVAQQKRPPPPPQQNWQPARRDARQSRYPPQQQEDEYEPQHYAPRPQHRQQYQQQDEYAPRPYQPRPTRGGTRGRGAPVRGGTRGRGRGQ